MMSLIMIIIAIVLITLGAPIFAALGLSAALSLIIFKPVPLIVIPQYLWSGSMSFLLTAVPLFMLTGVLMEKAGLGTKLLKFARVFTFWSKGPLGAANIIASFIFGGISGSSLADTVALGSIEIPEMQRQGYDLDYAAAVTAASSTLAVVVPPSILMIVLGAVAELSVGKLLLGGIGPGILMCGSMLLLNHIISFKRGYEKRKKGFDKQEILLSVKSGILPAIIPLIILLAMVTGFASPTEVAAIAVILVIVLTSVVYKSLSFAALYDSLVVTAKTTGGIMLIVVSSKLFTWVLTIDGMISKISKIAGFFPNPQMFLLFTVATLLFVGMVMDVVVAILIFAPLLVPIATNLGIDPVFYGVFFVSCLAVGLITPPFGVCLYSTCSVANTSVKKLVKALIPFFIALILSLVLMMFIPQTVLFWANLIK